MLARLRFHRLIRGHYKQDQIDPCDTGDHRADKSLMSGYVYNADTCARLNIPIREPKLDRDAAPALLLQPVRFDACECPHQGALTVVDVAGSSGCEVPHRVAAVLHRDCGASLGATAATASAGATTAATTAEACAASSACRDRRSCD